MEPGQNFQALVLPLAGGGPGVKKEVPGGENRHLRPGEGAEVSRQTPGLSVVGAHQGQGTAGGLVEGGGQIGPVDGGQTGQGDGLLALVHGLQQPGVILQPGEKLGQTGEGGGGRT